MTICLHMIVKNDTNIIQITLDSVVKYIDYWVICDYGSTDGTQLLIENYFLKHEIPGELHQMIWQGGGFGYNRTLALKKCKDKADYIWMMNADERLVGDFHLPTDIQVDAYKLKHQGDCWCNNLNILNNKLDWWFKGVTHEYLTCSIKIVKAVEIEGEYYVKCRR